MRVRSAAYLLAVVAFVLFAVASLSAWRHWGLNYDVLLASGLAAIVLSNILE